MSRKHLKVWITLNYIEHFLILVSVVTGCISISAFASLLGIALGIAIFAIVLKICAIPGEIKNYKKIIKTKKKSMITLFLNYWSENN